MEGLIAGSLKLSFVRWRFGLTLHQPRHITSAPSECDLIFILRRPDLFKEDANFVGRLRRVQVHTRTTESGVLERHHSPQSPERRLGHTQGSCFRAYALCPSGDQPQARKL